MRGLVLYKYSENNTGKNINLYFIRKKVARPTKAPVILSIIISINIGFFRIFLVYGLTGGFLTLLSVIIHGNVANKDSFYPPPIKESTDDKLRKVKQISTKDFKFCINCGTDLRGGNFKFCPECGIQLSSE